MTDVSLSQRQNARIATAFRAAEAKGVRVALTGRLGALLVIAVWQPFQSTWPDIVYEEFMIALFALSGIAQYYVALSGRRWHRALFILLAADAALLTVTLALPSPFVANDLHPAVFYRFAPFEYFFLLPVFSVLNLSPALVIWAGAASCLFWSAGLLRAATAEGAITTIDPARLDSLSMESLIAYVSQMNFIDIEDHVESMLILMIVSGMLALAVRRMRRLVTEQAQAERGRANLARYFSPNVVDELAAADRPFGQVRTQTVAVLFADIVGFTRQCETMAPDEAIALLRGFHSHMVESVHDVGGTLDKYLGDGVMATFGTPTPGRQDARNALGCARTMLARMESWNRERAARGETPVHIGIGVHRGAVVLGDIGSDRHMEFAVIGDAVNVASRLEALTRDLGADLVISEDLAQQAISEGAADLLAGFSAPVAQPLRGHDCPVTIRWFRQAAAGE